MPNIFEFGGPPRASMPAWFFQRGWWVPVDDTHHFRFELGVVMSEAEAAQRKALRKTILPKSESVLRDLLAGTRNLHDVTLEEFPGSTLVLLQDSTMLIGLGNLAERGAGEHLGRSDTGVRLLRSMWARELRALTEGRALTAWHRPEGLWQDVEARATAARQ